MRRKHLIAVPSRREVRVLVVDDHALFAEALMLTLSIDERIDVVGCASTGIEAVSLVEALRPDVVLMDIHMPRMDGLEATRRIREVSPRTWVVMVTSAQSTELAEAAKAAGASHFVTKDVPALRLIDTIVGFPAGTNLMPLPAHGENELRLAR
jgi:two-component system response regulator DesR